MNNDIINKFIREIIGLSLIIIFQAVVLSEFPEVLQSPLFRENHKFFIIYQNQFFKMPKAGRPKNVAGKRWKKSTPTFSRYIYKVLKQVHPETGVSSKSMSLFPKVVSYQTSTQLFFQRNLENNWIINLKKRLFSEPPKIIFSNCY